MSCPTSLCPLITGQIFYFIFILTVLQSNVRFSQFETPVDNDLVNAERFSQSVRQTVNTKGVENLGVRG